MEGQKEDKKLYIPVKIKRRKEVLNINGIGKEEATKIVIVSVIGLLIGIILFFLNNYDPFYIFAGFGISSGGAYIFLKKDNTNRNTIDVLMLQHKFRQSQKIYKYKYHNIYEKGDRNVKK